MWLNCGILLFIQLGNFLAQEIVVDTEDETNKPRITLQPFDIYAKSGSPAALVCEAEGDPLPVITWYQNGGPAETTKDNPLSNRIVLRESPSRIKLFFQSVIHTKKRKPDIGTYYCNATNIHGSAISRAAKVSIFTTGIVLEPTTATWEEAREACESSRFTLVPGRRYRAKKLTKILTDGQTVWLRGWRAVTDFTQDAEGKVKSLKVDVSRNIKKGIEYVCESGPSEYNIPAGTAASKDIAETSCSNLGYNLAMFDKEDYITKAFDVMKQDRPYWIGNVTTKKTIAKLCLAASYNGGKLSYIYDTCSKKHNYACLTDQDALDSFHYVVSFKMSIYKYFEKEIEEKKALTTSSTAPPPTTMAATTTITTTTLVPTTTTTTTTAATATTSTTPTTTSTTPATTSTTVPTTSTTEATTTSESSSTSTTTLPSTTTLSSTSTSPTPAIFPVDLTTELETTTTTTDMVSTTETTTPVVALLTDVFSFPQTTLGVSEVTETTARETTTDAVETTSSDQLMLGIIKDKAGMNTTDVFEKDMTTSLITSSTDSSSSGGVVILSGLTEKPSTSGNTMAKDTTTMSISDMSTTNSKSRSDIVFATSEKTVDISTSASNIPTVGDAGDKTQSTSLETIHLDMDKTDTPYIVDDNVEDSDKDIPGGGDIPVGEGETNVAGSTKKGDGDVPQDAWELPLIIAFIIMAVAVILALLLAFYLHRKRKTQKSKEITKESDVEMRPSPPVNGDKAARETATFKDATYDV